MLAPDRAPETHHDRATPAAQHRIGRHRRGAGAAVFPGIRQTDAGGIRQAGAVPNCCMRASSWWEKIFVLDTSRREMSQLFAPWERSLVLKSEAIGAIQRCRERVSSSTVRRLLAEGKVSRACRELGAPFALEGEVVQRAGNRLEANCPYAEPGVPQRGVAQKRRVRDAHARSRLRPPVALHHQCRIPADIRRRGPHGRDVSARSSCRSRGHTGSK